MRFSLYFSPQRFCSISLLLSSAFPACCWILCLGFVGLWISIKVFQFFSFSSYVSRALFSRPCKCSLPGPKDPNFIAYSFLVNYANMLLMRILSLLTEPYEQSMWVDSSSLLVPYCFTFIFLLPPTKFGIYASFSTLI